jgi:SAM-dependent methyltransferase
MQMEKSWRAAQTWRRLNTNTIGTDAYWWIAVQNAAFYMDMAPLIAGHARGRTLDVGAGRLAWRSLLTQHVASYFSGDVTKEHSDLDVVFDVTRGLPFADATFDTLFCCSVLEHAPEPWHALSEIYRVLIPDGIAIISLPFVLHLHDEPYDYYRFTRYGIEHLAKRAGFQVVEMVVNGGLFHLVLNLPSVMLSTIWEAAKLRALIRPTTRIWLALARRLDNVFNLKELFASNYIVVLTKNTRSNSGARSDE